MPAIAKKRHSITQETTYGLIASIGHRLREDREPMLAAVDCVQSWVRDGFALPLPAQAEARETFTVDEGGHRVETVSMLKNGVWALRWSHPDVGMGDASPPVPGRHWTVDISVADTDHSPTVGLRVSCATQADIQAPINYVRPRVVRTLAARVGLSQEVPLSGSPWVLHTEDDLDTLESLVISPNRRMPVFLISEIDKRKWDFTPHPPRFMVNGEFLARRALGYAHIVLMPYTLGFAWTQRVGLNWAAFDGSVRAYMPGLDFAEDTIKQHPIMYKRHIWEFAYGDQSGGRAFSAYLADRLATYGAHRPLRWEQAVFVPEARVRLADHRARHIAKLTDVSELRERYEAQIDALRQQVLEAENESEQWSDVSVQASKDLEHYKHENDALSRQLDALRANLEAKTGKPADAETPIPESYDEMPEWVSQHLAGRLVLLPRAINALKNASYEDVPLVYKALICLAEDYRNHRTGHMDFAAFRAKVKEVLGLDCSGSIDKSRAGEFGATYYVSYPPGSAQKQFLESHLRKGSTKDDRYTLGIYFFWDADTRQVVVGWLPSHLRNRMT